MVFSSRKLLLLRLVHAEQAAEQWQSDWTRSNRICGSQGSKKAKGLFTRTPEGDQLRQRGSRSQKVSGQVHSPEREHQNGETRANVPKSGST